jgi:hypothetical protein
MRWLVPLVLCAATSLSHADGWYFTEGFGGTNVKDDLSAYIGSAVRFRVSVGHRKGNWAFEAFMAGHLNTEIDYGPDTMYPTTKTSTYDPTNYPPDLITGGIDLKYIQPLSEHLEVYLRGSATVGALDNSLKDYSGRGLGIGAGIQLKGKGSVWGLAWFPLFWLVKVGPKMTGALWVDNGYEYYRLHGPYQGQVINAQLSHITVGYAVGTDF